MEKELFVVQRCWHSGPQQYQPLDYLRLFWSQRDAEEAAYHSAHAWARHHHKIGEVSVKTLLLPSYPAHNQSGTSYGFISHGCLFWVRSLMASVVVNSMSNLRNIYHNNEGFAVVTEGVIGGTGNRNSRRGTETPTGRVFVGPHTLRFTAVQVCHRVTESLQTCQSYVATMPIGKPGDYVSGNFLKDWPPQVLQPNLLLSSSSTQNKRESHWIAETENTSSSNEGMLVECPFEAPPVAKRRRLFASLEDSHTVSEDEMMMS
jgi:hypothetical protein